MTLRRRQSVPGFAWLESLLALAVLCLLGQLSWPAIEDWNNRPRPGMQVEQSFGPYRSLVYLPSEYGEEERPWPVLLFLHGAGERGDDLSALTRQGPPRLIAEGKHFPMIVVSPQCPQEKTWEPKAVLMVLDDLEKRFTVDTERVYLTGYSMGGYGTWRAAAAAPERFAAIAPLCGGGDPSEADQLATLPVWAFHGAEDEVVPLSATQEMVAAIQAAGGQPKLTVYSDDGHGICDKTYREGQLYSWFLSQQRPNHVEH